MNNQTRHIQRQNMHFSWHLFHLKTTILKWETNKLELKNKTQNTIIKTKQTMFENKNMLLSNMFCLKTTFLVGEKPTHLNSKRNSQNKKTCPKTKTCSCLIFLLFKNNHLEVRNQQTWTEKQNSKHKNQNKTNHVLKQKHVFFWYFLSKNNHVEAINKFQKPNGVIYGNHFYFDNDFVSYCNQW